MSNDKSYLYYLGKTTDLYVAGDPYIIPIVIQDRSGRAIWGKKRNPDYWLEVCGRCPLPECIRHEGDLNGTISQRTRAYWDCPVFVAQKKYDWKPSEAIENAEVLGLLEE